MAESTWQAYRTVLGSRVRAQTSYRASFALDVFGSVATGVVEFAEIYVIFTNVPVLGGLDFRSATLVFALANMGFSLADLLFGNVDEVPTYIRLGTLDVLLLRPLSVLGQIVSADLTLRRVGRGLFAAGLLAISLAGLPVDWTPARVGLLVVTPLAGTLLFGSLFVIAGAAQFWLLDGGEFMNAFTYGSSYTSSFSAAVFPLPIRLFFTFVVPGSFTAYLPTLALLGLPGPVALPAWLGWCAVPVAAGFAVLALAAWRFGLRHYVGGGG